MSLKSALITFGNEESYGLLFVAGELKRLRQEFRFFEGNNDVLQEIIDWKPNCLMYSPLTTFYSVASDINKQLRSHLPKAVSVFGGHHALAVPDIVKSDDIDTVVIGPVNGSIERILGGDTGIIRTTPTTPADLPTPARKEYYRDIPRIAKRYRKFMLSVLGCPWNCSYCSSSSGHIKSVFGTQVHKNYYLAHRPISDVIAEAKEIIKYETYEIEWVDDDIFAGDESWLFDFADAWCNNIKRESSVMPMYVSTTSAFALKVSNRVLRSIRRFVNVVGMGVQAIRGESLKLFNRSWDNLDKMRDAYDRLTSFGYRVNLQAIIGLPVDDPVEDAMETIIAIKDIGPGSICSIYPLMIYPGTEMEKYCRDNNVILNQDCSGDTNTAISNIKFSSDVTRMLRNICKLGTFFVKYNVDDRLMRALINIDYDQETSELLSLLRYYECVTDRLGDMGEKIFNDITKTMKLRY